MFRNSFFFSPLRTALSVLEVTTPPLWVPLCLSCFAYQRMVAHSVTHCRPPVPFTTHELLPTAVVLVPLTHSNGVFDARKIFIVATVMGVAGGRAYTTKTRSQTGQNPSCEIQCLFVCWTCSKRQRLPAHTRHGIGHGYQDYIIPAPAP